MCNTRRSQRWVKTITNPSPACLLTEVTHDYVNVSPVAQEHVGSYFSLQRITFGFNNLSFQKYKMITDMLMTQPSTEKCIVKNVYITEKVITEKVNNQK